MVLKNYFLKLMLPSLWASQVAWVVKNLPANAGDARLWFDSWVRKIPWSRKCQLTPVFLPGKSHGHRSLACCSPWAFKELDITEHTHTHTISLHVNCYLLFFFDFSLSLTHLLTFWKINENFSLVIIVLRELQLHVS